MIIGIVTRNPRGWASTQLVRAIEELGHRPYVFRFRDIYVEIGLGDRPSAVRTRDMDLTQLSALLVRPFGRVSLERAIFRMDILYTLQDLGVVVVNPPQAIEKAVDKYRSLHILAMKGIPVPPTIASENPNIVLEKVREHRIRDTVVKPIFGSRGHGSTRIKDFDTLWRVVQTVAYYRFVPYVQKYLRKGDRDIRAFVIGDRVVAAMYRVNPLSWKTNVAQGARPVPMKPDPELEDLAVKASKALGCLIAGVDIVECGGVRYVVEVNGQPGWRGLQSVTGIDIAKEIIEFVISIAKR